VAEVQGMEGDTILMQDLFLFDQTGIQNGRVVGALKSTGLRPRFAEKFAINNIELPVEIFTQGTTI
jgi:pilus assembly protein CpaF